VNLVPIGQFARMTRLSVKALRLYHEIGLLPPAHVDAGSGYRYYEREQANQAEVIRILRSVDMPLDQIRAFLDTEDRELAAKQLLIHRERLAERLAAQQRMLAYLESIIQNKGKIMPYEVQLTEEEPKSVAAVKIHTTRSKIANDVSSGFATLMHGLNRAGAAPAGAPMLVYHSEIDEETDGEIEICVPVDEGYSGDSAEVYGRELAGGTMAHTIHQGPYEQITPAYHAVAGWISENGYEIGGPPREIYLNDPRTVRPEELLTRVEFPICLEVQAG